MNRALALALMLAVTAGPAAGQLRSDFDGDGSVGFADFLSFAEAFGSKNATFDLDGSGVVDFADFLSFASDFGADAARKPHWIEHPVVNGPPGRLDHTMTLDPVRKRVLLFGGKRDLVVGDTWILDLKDMTWREVEVTNGPEARRGHTAIYDGSRDRAIIFCGETDDKFLNDVWAFDLATERWTLLNDSGDRPGVRYGLGAVLDAQRDRMVISHGFNDDGRFDDTWSFDLTAHTWSELQLTGNALPQARCLHDVVLDEARETFYLFGGCSSGVGPCPRGDLWRFDLDGQAWTEVGQSTERPSDRTNLRMARNPATGRAVLFGGVDTSARDDLWALEPDGTWMRLDTTGETPPPRWSHAMVVDEANGRMVVFSGTNGAVWYEDMWELRF